MRELQNQRDLPTSLRLRRLPCRIDEPPPHERPTWDLTAALVAARPDGGYFDLSPAGRVTVETDGFTRFTPAAAGRDRFLVLTTPQQSRTREALVQLVTQPPAR